MSTEIHSPKPHLWKSGWLFSSAITPPPFLKGGSDSTLSEDSDLLPSEGFDFHLLTCSSQPPLKPPKIQMEGTPTRSLPHLSKQSILPVGITYPAFDCT